jgi:choline dehydrogenase
VRHRANLEVATNALVEKVLIEEGRARGVVYGGKTGRRQVRARREVILSAGAIGSPQLLMLSGIGPGAQLQDHGIEVAQDLPGVGANLQDHLQIRTIYKCSRPITLNDRLRNPLNKIPMALEYLLFRSGPLTMAASHVCIFARSSPAFDRPDLQYHVQPWSADSPGEGTHRFSAFTLSTCQLRPESRGRIALTSPEPAAHPAIQPNYLSTPADQRSVIEALKLTRRLVATEALKPYVAAEYLPGPAVQSEAEMLEAAQRIAQTIYHPTGTCKMGSDPAAVVDARLSVHGVLGLRVVDASIMPNITSGNTNAPTIMIAEKASDMILEDAN